MKKSRKLRSYIEKIESYIPLFEINDPNVSKSTVGWQIDHALKVINAVVATLKTAPTNKTPKLTSAGRLCLTARHIPRGRGKAPHAVTPPEIILKKDIETQLQLAKKSINELESIHPKVTFKHPFFGILGKEKTITFLEVHTNHHLKIIKDILK